jgi:hypothetical protein
LKHQTNRPYINDKHKKNKQNYQQLFKFLDILLIDIEMFGEYKLFVENLLGHLENNYNYLKTISDKIANRIMNDDELKKVFEDFQKQYDYNLTNKTAINNSKLLSRSTIMKQVYKHLNIKPTKQPKK